MIYEIDGVQWISVKCFADDHPTSSVRNYAMRLTKSGHVNLHDVKVLRRTGYKVPLHYCEGGVRRLNPDAHWPKDVLFHGTPEVYEGASEDFFVVLKSGLAHVEYEWTED